MEIQSDSLLYGRENKESFCLVSFNIQYGFVVKRLLNLKTYLKKQQGEFKETEVVLVKCTFGDRTLAYSGAKVQKPFYPGDLVTCTGDWKSRSVSGRLPDYPGELAFMTMVSGCALPDHFPLLKFLG